MPFFEKPPVTVRKSLSIMKDELLANDIDQRGTHSRPKYQSAKQAIIRLGVRATPTLLEELKEHETSDLGSIERSLAEDIVEVLGKIGDTSAVPALVDLLPGIWVCVPGALASSQEGTDKLLAAAQSSDSHVRSAAVNGLWRTEYQKVAALSALATALADEDQSVRNNAVSAVIARGRPDGVLIDALQLMLRSDVDDRLRDRAESALRQLGVIFSPLTRIPLPPALRQILNAMPANHMEYIQLFANAWPEFEPNYVARRSMKYKDLFDQMASDYEKAIRWPDADLFVGDLAGTWMYLMTPPPPPASINHSIDEFWEAVVEGFSRDKQPAVKIGLVQLRSKFEEQAITLQTNMYT